MVHSVLLAVRCGVRTAGRRWSGAAAEKLHTWVAQVLVRRTAHDGWVSRRDVAPAGARDGTTLHYQRGQDEWVAHIHVLNG